jgi:predicted porin
LGEDNTAAGDATGANRDAGAVTSFAAFYAAGPLSANLAYQTEKLATTTTTTTLGAAGTTLAGTVSGLGNQITATTTTVSLPVNSTDYTRLSLAYDFGVAKPSFIYGKRNGWTNTLATGVSTTTDEYMVGVDVPFGATVLSASYATSQDSDSFLTTAQKRTGYGLTAKYSLSKRSFVYGGYETDTASASSTNTAADLKHSLFAVGIQHNF